MFFAVPAAQTAYADTQAPVKYVDENGTEHQVNSYTVLKNDMTEIGSAEGTWYVVNENVTFENNLKVKDNAKAHIILCDGKKMRCKDNITVNETSELMIWGQKETSGELESSGGYFSAYAAIGGGDNNDLVNQRGSGPSDGSLFSRSFYCSSAYSSMIAADALQPSRSAPASIIARASARVRMPPEALTCRSSPTVFRISST